MRRKSYFPASGQNPDLAIKFNDHNFPKYCNNSWIRRHFPAFHRTDKNQGYFYSQSIWLNDLEHCNIVSRAALSTGMIFIKFELGQPVFSWLIAFLPPIRYVTLRPWLLILWSRTLKSIHLEIFAYFWIKVPYNFKFTGHILMLFHTVALP